MGNVHHACDEIMVRLHFIFPIGIGSLEFLPVDGIDIGSDEVFGSIPAVVNDWNGKGRRWGNWSPVWHGQ